MKHAGHPYNPHSFNHPPVGLISQAPISPTTPLTAACVSPWLSAPKKKWKNDWVGITAGGSLGSLRSPSAGGAGATAQRCGGPAPLRGVVGLRLDGGFRLRRVCEPAVRLTTAATEWKQNHTREENSGDQWQVKVFWIDGIKPQNTRQPQLTHHDHIRHIHQAGVGAQLLVEELHR